jgi:hypothetical protein
MNLFKSINEISNPEYVFSKFLQAQEYTLRDDHLHLISVKHALYYSFGQKFKKKLLMNFLKLKLEQEQEIELKEYREIYIDLETFKYLFSVIKSNPEFLNAVTDFSFCELFYNNFLKDDLFNNNFTNNRSNHEVNLQNFKKRIKEKFPLLSNNFIEEIFIFLDDDRDGKLKINDFHNILNNNLNNN